jgi:hypothetical protein
MVWRLNQHTLLRDEQGGRFRVMQGIHLGEGPPGCDCDGCLTSGGHSHVYESVPAFAARSRASLRMKPDEVQKALEGYTGDLVDSLQDLEKRFGSEKFRRLGANEEATSDALASARREGYEEGLRAAQTSGSSLTPPGQTHTPQQVHALAGVEPPTRMASTPVTQTVDLDSMTVQELRQYAGEEEITLGYARTKEEILKVIRQAQAE